MMNNVEQLRELIKLGESEQLAFIKSVDKENIAKTLCAFLNTKGGRIIIGVDEDGIIDGIKDAVNHKIDLEKYLIKAIIPDSPIDISLERIDNFDFLVIKVGEGSKQPYIFDGTIFYRRKDCTFKATSEEISNLIHQRQKDEQHWERQIALGVEWEDLDHILIKETLEESINKYRSSYVGEDLQEFLNQYGLMSNGSYTNACVILFAKNTTKFLPQARVRLTEYAESKSDKNLLRDEVIEGNLFVIRKKLESYINSLGIKSTFDDNQWKRVDFGFPPKGLQEGVINALIHRDYSSYNSQMTISVYPDKLIIANSGQLPNEIKISDLKRNHRSFPVNPDIAHIVFLRGLIDKLGKGTVNITEVCKEAGLREPSWKQSKSEVILTFNGPKNLPKIIGSLTGTTSGANIVIETIEGRAIEGVIGTFEGASIIVKERLISLIMIVRDNPGIKNIELQDALNVSERTVTSDVKRLEKIITYEGSQKGGGYYLVDEFKNELDMKLGE